jgi:hypothetical protein
MNFNFRLFEQMTDAEAVAWQREFLEQERHAWRELVAEAERAGLKTDFSLESVGPILGWLAEQVRTIPVAPDPSISDDIRSHPSYSYALFDFDEPSRALILRGGYYLGEAFVRAHPQLRWGIARRDTAEQRQPAVLGFSNSDLSVLLVVWNLFGRVVVDPARRADFARTVETWRRFVPERVAEKA